MEEEDYEGSIRSSGCARDSSRAFGHADRGRVHPENLAATGREAGRRVRASGGHYDVKIEYRGFGNAAELHFFQGGVFKHKNPAEARGFPAQPVSDVSSINAKGGIESACCVEKSGAATGEHFPKSELTVRKAGGESFSWGAYGFTGAPGKVVPFGKGQVKLVFDSSNSAAGFSAILPYIEKVRK